MIHLIIALDEGTDIDKDLLIRRDYEAWRVIDIDGWSAGVGYQAVLGVSDVNRLGYAMTYIRLAEDPAAHECGDDARAW